MRRPLALPTALALLAPNFLSAQQAVVHTDVGRRLAEAEQPVKVWAFFRDKGFESAADERAALDALYDTIPARTLERRELRRSRAGLVDALDLPVDPEYVTEMGRLGLEVHAQSRWLNGVSVTINSEQLDGLSALPFVREVRLVNRSLPLTTTLGGCFGTGGGFYGNARGQTELSNIDLLHTAGFTGDGIVIGVLDTGFQTTHNAFNTAGHPLQVLASWDFVDDDANVGIEAGDDPSQHDHGTTILGTLAAYDPNTLVGAAYDAEYILCKTEDVANEVQAEEDFYVEGLEFAELNGADVVTSSLGYIDWYTQADLDGVTAVTTRAVNIATANGVFCCTAAGNAAHDTDPATATLIAPADAFEVITVGAVEITGEVAWFSSSGPTADGRVKPETLAMGDSVASVATFDDVSIGCTSGTSLSTPIVAGIVACLAQAHPNWGVSTMRNQIIENGSYFGDPLPDPLGIYGHGMLDALAAHTSPVPFAAAPMFPGRAGEFNAIDVTGATPGDPVVFLFGTLSGTFDVPGCSGVTFDVFPDILLTVSSASAGGEAPVGGTVGPGAVGLTVLSQGIELTTCRVTNVVSTTFL